MKLTKTILAFVIAALLLGIFAGCTATAPTIHVTLRFSVEGSEPFFDQDIEIKSDAPTVESVINEVAMIYGALFTELKYDSRYSLSLTFDGDEYPDSLEKYWDFKLNGVDATAKANMTPVKDLDTIDYIYLNNEALQSEEATEVASDEEPAAE